MTYSQAVKYAEIFKVLADPQALLIVALLKDYTEPMPVEEIAEKVNCGTNEANRVCTLLEGKDILDRKNQNGVTSYEYTSSQNSRQVEQVIEMLT